MHIIPASDYFAAELTPPSTARVSEQQQVKQGRQQQQRWRPALRGKVAAAS
jgi:hypothetical protein